MFRNQNIRQRQKQAEDTTEFLAKQLEEAKTKLDEQDARLAAFQSRRMRGRPDDEKANVTLLAGATTQLEAVTPQSGGQQKAFVESLLNQPLADLKKTRGGQTSKSLEQQLSDMQNELAVLERRYTDKHPKVIQLKRAIAQLENQIVAMPSKDQNAADGQAPAIPVADTPQIQQDRVQLRQLELSIALETKEQEDLQHQIRVLQGRIELSPTIQQEFKALTRNYQTALNFYNDLLEERNESQMAATLENQQQAEKFRMLDPPSLPEQPSFPNRELFGQGGFCAGLALGVGIGHLSEARDKSMRSRRDVEIYLGVPTLGHISHTGSAGKIRYLTNGGVRPRQSELSLTPSSWKERNV